MEPKLCPFCGSDASLEKNIHTDIYSLGCSDKHCCGHWVYCAEDPKNISIDKAIIMWNHRV